jgi:CDP-6-deoxy-D-xylo-4-hexulose-3-dehydrase
VEVTINQIGIQMADKMEQIKHLIGEYIAEKQQNKKFIPNVDYVKYSGPYFDKNEYQAAVETLLSGWLIFGEKNREFEEEFAKVAGLNYSVLTNSGSSANLLMLSALMSKNKKNKWKLVKGDKVITPVVCFPTTINPIYQNGLEPVFVDVERGTLNINLDLLEDKLNSWDPAVSGDKPKVLLFAHVLGNPPDMDRVMRICTDHKLILLEDCCDALGSTYKGKKLGTFGLMSTTSFFPAHHMTMGEGGVISTNENRLKTILKSLRDWGRACYCNDMKPGDVTEGTACGDRFRNWLPGLPEASYDHRYVFDEIGYNLKPLDLQGAIGLEQLKKLPEMEAARKNNYNKLYSIFSKYKGFFTISERTEGADPSWFGFLVTLNPGTPFSKEEIVRFFEKNKIQTRSYFTGNVLAHPAYFDPENNTINEYQYANEATFNTFFLGTFIGITEDMLNHIEATLDTLVDSKTDTQQAPKPGNSPSVWDAVIGDMRNRDEVGRKKYGVPLQWDNGRNSLQDAYEEALDLAVYLKAEIEKNKQNETPKPNKCVGCDCGVLND